ncbi:MULTISPECIES: S1C family serine protease [Rhodanobacter]|jgi:serine protease DegS/serine protease DegQ|uniref:Serine protease DegS/serine protease DegQ n=1 Tax=Rhodanobacter glycinis TaxID=582702 RepID=A0A1I4BJM1_9GAMM|nr:trypsin-like peptidase domain-containing protein [Rhodanobacter glycinis]TAM26149.1 MAG: trypsin-like serine protease [Rhodanobacter sp.]SFK68131.1 serine protease DegS/serine protease DegQ [Rhodanobacter glycinis]
MKHAAGLLAFVARFAVLGLALAFVIGLFWPGVGSRLRAHFGMPVAQPAAATAAAPEAPPAPASYADAVARAEPSVVNIYANKVVTEQAVRMYSDPLMQRLFGGHLVGTYQHPEQSLGSGVIVSDKGYVLTNNHVIANANDIQVLLYDGRVAKATLVGADPETDLAVLKINAGNLQPIRMADQKKLRVGDVVLAIGNPLGLNQTVTMGIISTIGRQLVSGSPEDFIQTDAAINLGNSGGALVNTRGELVGINTLLIGKAADAEGIGFAIPVNTATEVLKQLIATGHVVRGWLGADYAFVPVAADSGLPAAARGVQVTDVYPGSPAALAGIQPHDILLRMGTHGILDPADLRRYEASLKPGTTLEVSGLRNGSPFHVKVTLIARPAQASVSLQQGQS